MKYVMFENVHGHKFPVIFPEAFVHEDVSRFITYMYYDTNKEILKTTSAGSISSEKITAHGKSETLNLEAHELDSVFITFNDSIGTLDFSIAPPSILETLIERLKESK